MSSRDADTDISIDTGVPMPRALAEATTRLTDFGIYGYVWLDKDLRVRNSFGHLVGFIEDGKPITHSVMALIGLEADILALRQTPHKLLELPAVAVATADAAPVRLNFTVFWMPDEDRPMLFAFRANSQTEMELELSKQIRARHIAESDLAAKSKELARANADLESFAAIVSHDLKAPLRHMRTIADTLIVETAQRGDGACADRLCQLQDLSRRMAHMLTELFDYASLGRKFEGVAPVNTRTLAQVIVESLSLSGFRFSIEGTWPTISTLAAPLDLVLRNLLQNAIQHHDRPPGAITLACAPEPNALAISISDDGPGIAARDHASIFLPFRTLDTTAAARGTGMGLAIVKKAVETAGGSIEVASDPSARRGTIFTVRWPMRITA